MKFLKLKMQPLVLPHLDGYLAEARHLHFILGVALVVLAALVFSIWRDQLLALKGDERAKFLMFNLKGGSWVVAVFAFCGGIYFLCASILQLRV